MPFCQSIWLVFSSCFFLLPAIYARSMHCYLFYYLSIITSLMSAIHWIQAETGLRQKIDILTAIVSFFIYFVTGVIFIRGYILLTLGIIGLFFMLSCFYLSHKMASIGSSKWICFHFCFHICVALEQLLVIYAMMHT